MLHNIFGINKKPTDWETGKAPFLGVPTIMRMLKFSKNKVDSNPRIDPWNQREHLWELIYVVVDNIGAQKSAQAGFWMWKTSSLLHLWQRLRLTHSGMHNTLGPYSIKWAIACACNLRKTEATSWAPHEISLRDKHLSNLIDGQYLPWVTNMALAGTRSLLKIIVRNPHSRWLHRDEYYDFLIIYN